MAEQLRLPLSSVADVRDGWVTGKVADREGPAVYVHLIRAPGDPARSPRADRKTDPTEWRRRMNPGRWQEWMLDTMKLLEDGKPRTFNRICLELSDNHYTADVAFGMAPDIGLWHLVENKMVEHTLVAPILFRAVSRATQGGDHGGRDSKKR